MYGITIKMARLKSIMSTILISKELHCIIKIQVSFTGKELMLSIYPDVNLPRVFNLFKLRGVCQFRVVVTAPANKEREGK